MYSQILDPNCFHLHSFPKAAVTKYHKLGDLEQQWFIISHYWRLEIEIKV